jgi:predicted XRE-type DNA-binding protein
MHGRRESVVCPLLSQAEAAQVLGISQSRVSNLIRGKFEKFSLDMLITLATRAGKKVELKMAA